MLYLNAPDRQTANTSVLMVTPADDQLIKCIWLADRYHFNSCGSNKDVVDIGAAQYLEKTSS